MLARLEENKRLLRWIAVGMAILFTAVFIWLNSLSGLVARLQYNAIALHDYIPLILAVFLGGALGSFMGSSRYSPQTLERVLGVLVLVAIVLLLKKLLAGQ